MLHRWSVEQDERFAFWSRMEIVRVSVIAGLAIIPVSVAAVDAPAAKVKSAQMQRDAKPADQTGRLLSTRQVAFDVRALDMSSMGDREPDPVR